MISMIKSYQKNSDSVNPGLSGFQRKELNETFRQKKNLSKKHVPEPDLEQR